MSSSRTTTAHARAIHLAAQPGAFSSSKSHRDLVKSLRGLSSALIASATNDSGPNVPVGSIAQQLATSAILQNSRPEIHLGASLCFVELFKLSAPSAPWHGETLRDVLRLLIKQVALIGESESSQIMLDQFHILESLAVVKIPLVLLDDEADDPEANLSVLADLFETSMKIAGRGLPQQFENCIRDMLSCVLDEADPLPKSLIVILLAAIIDRSAGAQRSLDLAKRVILECRGVLEPVLAEIIGDIASTKSSATVKSLGTRSRQAELIYELAALDAGLLRSSTHHLQDALESPDEELRLLFVKLLGRVFATAECHIMNEFSLLLNAYLKRATDISGRIREEFVVRSSQILAQVSEIRIHLTTVLTERALDTCDRVRAVLVRSICDLSQASPEVVDAALLEAIGGRLLDKKATVRHEAIHGLSSLFKTHCSRYWSESQPVPVSFKKFAWIPSRLIALYTLTFPDRNQAVDRVLDEVIFDHNLEAAARALLISAAYTTCDSLQQKAFIRHFITDKRQAASLLNDALSLRDRLREVPESDQSQIARLTRQRDQRLQSLTGYLPTSIDLKQLQALFAERDGNVFKWLRFCSESGRDTAEVRAAMMELHGALATSKKVQVVADALATSVAMFTLGRDLIPHLFELGAHHSNPKLAAGVRAVVLALAEQAPGLFTDQLQPISAAITFPATSVSEFALHTTALCSLGEVTATHSVPVLLQFCESGSEQQSSWAATILSQEASSVAELLAKAASGLNQTPGTHAVSVLSASATIARLKPQLFHDHESAKQIIDFAYDAIQKSSDSDATDLIRNALRLMTDYVIGLELDVTLSSESNTKPYRESLLTRLWALLADSVAVPSALVTDAFTSILSLMTVAHIEGASSPHEFAILAGAVMRNRDDAVRAVFIEQLWQRLVVLRLPFRYAILLALAAADTTDGRRARKLLSVLVGRLRQAAALASRPPSPAQLPETALVHLVHALAAQPDFDHCSAVQLRVRARYLGTFLDAILCGQQHNFEFLIALLTQLRACVPLTGTDRVLQPERLYALADLSLILIRRRYQGQQWSSSGDEERLSRKIALSSSWFRKLPAPVPGSFLPPGFTLTDSPHTTPARKPSSATPRKTPISAQRKRRKPSETGRTPSAPKALRQLPPRRAKRSLQSVSSLLNSSDDDDGEDSDVISHEYEVADQFDPVRMGTQASLSASKADSPSPSNVPVSASDEPSPAISASKHSDGSIRPDSIELAADRSKSVPVSSANEPGADLIDVLMETDENIAPESISKSTTTPAPAALRSTFQLRRSRRHPS